VGRARDRTWLRRHVAYRPYDPEAKLLYWPTGTLSDYNGDERKGDNLYTASVVASIRPPAS